MIRHISTNHKLQNIFLLVVIAIPLTLALVLILSINLTFWYDNTRDLLAAWNNLTKLTLIGPPSGIPGIFYGPYWIWLLSFGLLFSKNPLIVTIITATVPYFVLFPLLWFRLKVFDRTSLIIGWLLFIFSSGMTYATQLWNLYPAPLVLLAIIYIFIDSNFLKITRRQTILAAICGFLIGLLVNFDISFGIAFIAGTILFLIVDTVAAILQKVKISQSEIIINKIFYVISLFVGFLISFLPTMLFELRHGFHQTQTLLHTLFKYGDVVTVTGLNKSQILQMYPKTFGDLLHLPIIWAGIILLVLIVIVYYLSLKHIIKLEKNDVRILLLLGSLFAGNLIIYLTAKNPVWDYHFIGVDILFLLLFVFFSHKLPSLFRKAFLVYAIIIMFISIATFIIYFHRHTSHFEQQLDVVKIIKADVDTNNYTVFAYNPSIYTYDFSYLFRWMADKDIPYDPGLIKQSAHIMYLIVPINRDTKVEGFIQFRSQPTKYKEVKVWKTETDYEVIKYIKR